MYEVYLSGENKGFLSLRFESRDDIRPLFNLAMYHSLDFSVKEVKDDKPDE